MNRLKCHLPELEIEAADLPQQGQNERGLAGPKKGAMTRLSRTGDCDR